MKKILYLFILSTSIAFSQQTKFQKIDSLLTFLYQNNKFMGSLAIREGDNTVFAKAYGFADIESKKELNPSTKLKIGSITKTFTAVMIMQLIDEKKLTLDTKLSQFYPKIPNAEKITIRMLLHHRTGIPDFLNDDPEIGNFIYVKNSKTDLVKRIEAYKPAFEPDSKYTYSNSNYNLLGYILEDITKKSYVENLFMRITSKVGLKNTLLPTKININANESYSYMSDGTTWIKTPEWDNSLAFAAGAISSTPTDLLLFLKALFDGKLVSKNALTEMTTMVDEYGKGLISMQVDNKQFYGHTGGIENFRAFAGYSPDEKVGFAIVVNGDNYNHNEIMSAVRKLYYGTPYTFPDLNGYAVPEPVLSGYVGNYTSKTLPLPISIRVENGKLMAQAEGQGAFALTAKSETEFVFEAAGIELVFGNKTFTLKQGGGEFVYTKE